MPQHPDRPTPRDPLPAVRIEPGRAQREDAQRLARDAESAARQAARGKPAPPATNRHRTPESGGVEAQPKHVEVELAPLEQEPHSKAPTRSDWAKLRFKLASALVGGLVLIIGAGAFYVVTLLQARSEAQRATKKAETATTSTDKTAERIAAVEAYLAADAERRACLDGQLRDAVGRGTGHVIVSLPKSDVNWVEQNSPKAVPRILWAKPTWFTVETCAAAPSVPKPAP